MNDDQVIQLDPRSPLAQYLAAHKEQSLRVEISDAQADFFIRGIVAMIIRAEGEPPIWFPLRIE